MGYGDEIRASRNQRFAHYFGKQNVVFKMDEYDLVNVYSLCLDGCLTEHLKEDAWALLKNMETSTRPTILLTHVPLYKSNGFCADSYKLTRTRYVCTFVAFTIVEKIMCLNKPCFHQKQAITFWTNPNPSLSFLVMTMKVVHLRIAPRMVP